MSEFELVRTEAANHTASVKRMCRLLGVSRFGYYGHVARRLDPPPSQDDRLVAMMRAIHGVCEGAYGVRRMHRERVEADEMVSRKRVRRLMRESGIRAVQTPRFTKTTDSKHDLGYAPNLLQQDFTTTAQDRAWAGDITYIWTAEGWCYLAVLLDLYCRRVVGWAMDDNLRTDLPLRALQRALDAVDEGLGGVGGRTGGSASRLFLEVAWRIMLRIWNVRLAFLVPCRIVPWTLGVLLQLQQLPKMLRRFHFLLCRLVRRVEEEQPADVPSEQE